MNNNNDALLILFVVILLLLILYLIQKIIMKKTMREGFDLVSMPLSGTVAKTNLVESFEVSPPPMSILKDLSVPKLVSLFAGSLNIEESFENTDTPEDKLKKIVKSVKSKIENVVNLISPQYFTRPIEQMVPKQVMDEPISTILPESIARHLTEILDKPLREVIPPGASLNDIADKA
jgi:hypothetical protein